MVKVSDEMKSEINKLPDILQREWNEVTRFHSIKTGDQVFKEFKQRYDNFQGPTIDGFLKMTDAVYKEWRFWKYQNIYNTEFISYNNNTETEKTLTQVWKEFREYWQFDTEESNKMFEEMEYLSDKMLNEWRLKYTFEYPHVYEKDSTHYSGVQRDYEDKSKAQLFNEFKVIWDMDMAAYTEDIFNEMNEYVNGISGDNIRYFKDYPATFWEYCEDSNHHSFDSYSVLEQFEICEHWEEYRVEKGDYKE